MKLAGPPRFDCAVARLLAAGFALASVGVANVTGAQVPVPLSQAAPPAADTIASFDRPNGALMRAGTLTYVLSLARVGGDTTALGRRTVSVSEISVGGVPSWLIAESRLGTVVETTDSVSLARADLAPERWSATIGKARFAASFTRDSMFGGIETYQGRASFGVPVPVNALLSAGMVERIVEMLPLHDGYRAAASLVLVAGQTPEVVRSEILVEGTDTLTVGRQSIECWRVVLRTAGTEECFWVARDGARVVRSEQLVPGGTLRADFQP